MIYAVMCDGGRSPGYSYGSYVIYANNKEVLRVSKRALPRAQTSNEAEYLILIAALQQLVKIAEKRDKIKIKTDSRLLVNHLNKEWRVDKLLPYYNELMGLLQNYQWKAEWWHRSNSVKLFGH